MPSSSHTVRFPDPLWDEGQAAAKSRGESLNGYLIGAVRDLVAEHSWRERALAAEAEVARLTGQMARER